MSPVAVLVVLMCAVAVLALGWLLMGVWLRERDRAAREVKKRHRRCAGDDCWVCGRDEE